MNALAALHQKYLWHATRIYRRAGDKPLTEDQQRGVDYYTNAAKAVEALQLR